MTYSPLKRKPTYYMQVPFQMLKVAPLLRTSFLHSSSGPTINSKTLLQKPDIAPLTYPNLLHLCASPFPYSNSTFLHFSPSNVITLSRLKKSDFFFFWHGHVITSNHAHLSESHRGLMTSTVTGRGDTRLSPDSRWLIHTHWRSAIQQRHDHA